MPALRGEIMPQEKSGSSLLRSEDWWAVWLGLLIFILALGKPPVPTSWDG
ncbi:hypothetical protein [Thermodesulfitimonas sp.]